MSIRHFLRGVTAGICLLQGLQLLTPDLFLVYTWPIWARVAAGIPFLLMGIFYVLAQRRLTQAGG